MHIHFDLLSFHSYDKDCKGFALLTIGMLERSLFTLSSGQLPPP